MKHISFNCKHCGKHKEVQASKYKGRNKPQFCSYFCRGKLRYKGLTGEKHPAWKGGRNINSDGYVRLRINGKDVLEHRHLMEKHLGRKLEIFEHVHHVNNIRTDNKLENLKVMLHGEHISYHRKGSTFKRNSSGQFC